MSKVLRNFFFTKTGIDIVDEVPIFSPNYYFLKTSESNGSGSVSLTEYLMSRLKTLGTFDILYQDLSDIIKKPLILEVVRQVGEIYSETDARDAGSIVGHFQGYLVNSSNPNLIDPKIVSDLLNPFSSEHFKDLDSRILDCNFDESKLSNLARLVDSGEIVSA